MRAAVVGTLLTTLIAAGAAEAQILAGGEFRVNEATTAYLSFPSLAADPGGSFIATWVEVDDPRVIVGHRFDAAGRPWGTQFRVNEAAAGNFQRPDVAVDATGRAMVIWTNDPGASVPGVFGRVFDINGRALGPQFTISKVAAYEPSVVAVPSGFVVVWSTDTQKDDGAGIVGRRIDVAGNALGPEFRVNADDYGYQIVPRAAATDTGSFVVAWSSYGSDGLQVLTQRFDESAAPVGKEIVVATSGLDAPEASVATDADGNFVVVWVGATAVRGRRFALDGTPQGGEFVVNTAPAATVYSPIVVSDKTGNFTVVWEAGPLGETDVFARRFTASGAPRGAEVRVNSGTTGIQPVPTAVSDATGNVFVSWLSTHESPNYQVFGQRVGGLWAGPMDVTDGANEVIEVGDSFTLNTSWANIRGAQQSFSGRVTGTDSPAGLDLTVTSPTASYGTVPDGTMAACVGPCIGGTLTGTRPPRHVDMEVVETIEPDVQGQAKRWQVHVGDTFSDVPRSHKNYRFVETLVHHNITGGCTMAAYCPNNPATREQMAVFVLLGKEGAGYLPPACGTPRFADVPASSSFCPWVEEVARRQAATGCGGANFCANVPITREEMAVLVLRVLDPLLDPPACTTPMFDDVPADSPYCRWIEELVRRGGVDPCSQTSYCPSEPVTRHLMAEFITRTFSLELYGPLLGHVPRMEGESPEGRPTGRR